MSGEPDDGGGLPHDETHDRVRIAEEINAGVHSVAAADIPASLCAVATRLLPVDGASISVVGSDEGDLRMTLCSSDPVAERLAEIQYTVGDGPSRQAVIARGPVLAGNLTAGPDARRWPVFAQQAVEAGAAAAFSLPLGHGGGVFGTLDLHRDRPGTLGDRDVRLMLLTADAVGLAVLSLDGRYPAGAWLERAEGSRHEVHQATGMIMIQLDVGAEEALAALRARAFTDGRTVSDVAVDVIARRVDLRGR